MGQILLFILLFFNGLNLGSGSNSKPQCKFTSTHGFYAHVQSDLTIGEIIFKGSVSPEDAEMVITNVRSDVLNNTDWSDRVVIDRSNLSPGSFVVRVSAQLSLPVYPSTIQETNVFITVVCNGYSYPLFTIHVDETNRFAPQFYNEPYILPISKDLPIWGVIDTPVAAIDWDPSENYTLKFKLEDAHKGFELLDESPRRTSTDLISGSEKWKAGQVPTMVQLRIVDKYELPARLRLSVSDDQKPPRKSTTFIYLADKSKTPTTIFTTPTTSPTTTTTTTKITTTSPSTTTSTTTPSPIEEDKNLINTLKKTIDELLPKKKESEVKEKIFGTKNRELNAIELLETNEEEEDQEENPTYFANCSSRVKILENSGVGTRVIDLDVVNPKNSTIITLVDPDNSFQLLPNFSIIVSQPKMLDRERFTTLEIVAELRDELPTILGCSRKRIHVDLEDVNDNRPVFELEDYFFHISDQVPVGQEVARIVAQDIDQGSNGQVTYSIPTKNVPFEIVGEGKRGVIRTTSLLNPEIRAYNFEVEAKDNGKEPRSAKVPVEVFILKSKLGNDEDEEEVPEVHGNIQMSTEALEETTTSEESEEASTSLTSTSETPESEEASTPSTSNSEAPSEASESEEASTPSTSTSEFEEASTSSTSTSEASESEEEDEESFEDSTIPTSTSEASSEFSEFEEASTPSTSTSESPSESSESKEASNPSTSTPESSVMHAAKSLKIDQEVEETVEVPMTNIDLFIQRQNAVNPGEHQKSEPELQGAPDEQQEKPERFEFKQKMYTYDAIGSEIRENDVLGRVDAAPNAEFFAVDREVAGVIKLSESGEILAGKGLTRLEDGPLTFGVSSTNGFETARAQVTILRDANRDLMTSNPRFDQDKYKFHILENQQPEVIGICRAFHSALSSSPSLRLTYSLIAPANIDDLPFEIHEQSGEVSTSRPLDAEQQNVYKFQVRSCLTQSICSISDVFVFVDDANDNPPIFLNRELETTVESDIPIGTKVIRVYAKDTDKSFNNSRITFTIASDSPDFEIDEQTGQLRTRQSLLQSLYKILIHASDNGIPRRLDTAQLTVTVRGTNPSSPVFDQKDYSLVISAPVRAGQVVGEVHASDPDPGEEGKVKYRLLPADNQDHQKFSINSKTGVISALTSLSLNDGPIQLNVEASDSGKNTNRKAKTSVFVEIIDPKTLKFLPLPTTVYISTEKAVGSVVLRVSATTTDDSNIKFRVLQDSSQFIMDGDLLRVSNHLLEGESVLTIRAETDTAQVDHQLKVIVMADRDKYPVFPQLTYDFDVATDDGAHFPRVIHQFNAKLLNGTIRYTFFPPTPPAGFYLDEQTGELFVTTTFGAENHDTVFIVVRAINVDFKKFYSDVGVAVMPVSKTVEKLRFRENSYNFEVFENTEEGAIIGKINVNGFFSTLNISPDNDFLGIHQNGSVFLRNSIDAEELDELIHDFTVTASNGKETTKARVQVAIRDVNEFDPEFDETEIEFSLLTSNLQAGTRIGRVIAHDKDISEKTRLTYRIVGGSGRKLVFIREDGTIILGDEQIDKHLDHFDLIIEAVDRNGKHDQTHVTVYIDSDEEEEETDPPVFMNQPLEWNVTEASTELFEVRAEGSDIVYRIVGGDLGGNFKLVPTNNGSTKIQIVSELDHRKQSTYILQIEAKDTRTQQTALGELTIHLKDMNLHEPTFEQPDFSTSVKSDLPVGFPIITIQATDLDRDPLTYSLQGDPCDNQFSIDNQGRVSFRVPKPDRLIGQIICLVVATDGKHTSSSNLKLTVDDGQMKNKNEGANSPPKFEKDEYTFDVTEDKSKVIGKVTAIDSEGDLIQYSIEPAQYRNLFIVDQSGALTLNNVELDEPAYTFIIVAEDISHQPILSTFTNIKINLPREASEQSDNEVTIATKAPLGRSTTKQQFDNVTFKQPKYSWIIEESLPIGAIIGNVEIMKPDHTVDYSFISGDYLSVDQDGRVAVLQPISKPINDVVIATRGGNILAETRVVVTLNESTKTTSRPTTTSATTSVTTTQKSSTTTTTTPPRAPEVITNIVPVPTKPLEFNKPIYFAFVSEGTFKNGKEIEIKPEALSIKNVEDYSRIAYSIEDKTTKMPFFLTEEGKLIVLEADHEKHHSYNFIVVAKSDTQIARTRLNVTILDVNDNSPIFDSYPEVIGVSKDMHIGSPIYQMKASDADVDSSITYEITPKHYFSIDPRDGLLRVLSNLQDAPDDIELVIVATDSGVPPRKSEARIVIRLFANVMTGPKLPESFSEIIVNGSTAPGTTVKQLVAGPTVSENDKILYHLSNNSNNLFEIRDNGVLILTRKPHPTELNKYYSLNVTAENSKGADWKVINIYVEGDVPSPSSSTPILVDCHFSQKIYRANVTENQKVKTSVVKVASDCANRADKKIRYTFHHPTNEFEINENTGEITTTQPFDREVKNFYFLTVNVVEQTRRKRQSETSISQAASKLSSWQTLVIVSVLDENDNSPSFLHLSADGALSAIVDQNADLLTPIIHVQARDLDIVPSELKFNLEGDSTSTFHINSTTGLVQLAKPLDQSTKRMFDLEVTVSDGTHLVNAPLSIHILSVDTNLVQLTKDTSHSAIDPLTLERTLTETLGIESRILVAQPYVDDTGRADSKRSHVFVYALEGGRPIDREDLKELLMLHSDELTRQQISSVSLLSTPRNGALSSQTVVTAVLILLLIALLIFICSLIVCCFKRRSKTTNAIIEGAYMVDSTGSGPRPYDVANISRTTAQNVLASRPLPNPQENQVELAVSPVFQPNMERENTTKEFSNSVRERPSLIPTTTKVHAELKHF